MPRTVKTQRKGQNSPSMEIVDKDRRVADAMRLPATLTTLEATLMRCPKLRKLNYDLYYFDTWA